MSRDAFPDDFALKLGERQQDIEGEPSHRGRGVELLRDGDEGHPVTIEQLDNLREIHQRPGQSIDLVDHDRIDPMLGDVREEALQGRPLQGSAGQPAIIIAGLDQPPSFAPLAADEGLARFALGVQRIEVLLQSLFGGFAGVDGTASYRRFQRHVVNPKNRGPDEWAPVIRRATSDSERYRSPR